MSPDAFALIRPIGEWMLRIDRGDILRLETEGAGRGELYAGRLAGQYVVMVDRRAEMQPATPEARESLLRLRLEAFNAGNPVKLRWTELGALGDAMDSVRHRVQLSGTGSGGTWTVDYVRRPDGQFDVITTLNNDADSMWSPEPTTTTAIRSEAEARKAVLDHMVESGWFPLIQPKT